MEKIKLTATEFLTVYTGVYLGDWDALISVEEKISVEDVKMGFSEFQQSFKDFVNENMPDLCDAVQNIGPFRKEDGKDIYQEIDEYIGKFKREIGSETIIVDLDKYKDYVYARNQVEEQTF